MRAIKSLDDVQTVLKDLDNFKSRMESQVWDLHGRQIKNGGLATDPNDFVLLRQLGQPVTQEDLVQFKKGLPVPLSRTLLIKDTAVRDDAADHVVIFGNGGPYVAHFFFGVLRKPILVDLTIRVHHVFQGTDTVLGTYTIPKTTGVDVAVTFTITQPLIHKAVLTWDITNSDGSADADGIASFTIVWF